MGRQERNYTGRVWGSPINVGDKVYYVVRKKEVGRCPKFMSPWSGPWTVTRSLGGPIFEIKMGRKVRITHYDLLKKGPTDTKEGEDAPATTDIGGPGPAGDTAQISGPGADPVDDPVATAMGSPVGGPVDNPVGDPVGRQELARRVGKVTAAPPPATAEVSQQHPDVGSRPAAMMTVGLDTTVLLPGRGRRQLPSYHPNFPIEREKEGKFPEIRTQWGPRGVAKVQTSRDSAGHGCRLRDRVHPAQRERQVGGGFQEVKIELPVSLEYPKDIPSLSPTTVVRPPWAVWILFLPSTTGVRVIRWIPSEECFPEIATVCPRYVGETLAKMSARVRAIFTAKNSLYAEQDKERERVGGRERGMVARWKRRPPGRRWRRLE